MAEAKLEPNQISKKNVSVKTAIGLKLLTVFASSSIPDGWVWLGWTLDTPQDVIKYKMFCQTKCHSPVQNTSATLKQSSGL